jgi:hypothetical protein
MAPRGMKAAVMAAMALLALASVASADFSQVRERWRQTNTTPNIAQPHLLQPQFGVTAHQTRPRAGALGF